MSFTYDGQRGRVLTTSTLAGDAEIPTSTSTTEEPEESETETETPTESEDITTTITVGPTRATSAEPAATEDGGDDDGPNIGAIVGGSIGGFVALSLIVLGAIWLLRRNKKNQAPPNQPAPATAPPTMPHHTPVASVPPMSEHTGLVSPTSPAQSDWRGSSIAPTTQSPVSMQGWSTHSPAANQPYNAVTQNQNYQ